MNMSHTPSAARSDAIVIGSGAAGLTCATTLASAGLRVVLLEKNEWVGGYAHGFGQDGFYWDHGGHIFLGYQLGGQARTVFQRLGLDQHLEMLPDKHDYQCVFPDESLAIPADLTEAADILAERFPEERDGIVKVLLTMERMIDDVNRFVPSFRVSTRPGQRHWLDPVMEQFQRPTVGKVASRLAAALGGPGSTLLKYQPRTLRDLLDEHLRDPRLKAYFSMLSAGIGEGPATLSAVIAGVFFVHSLRTMWMPRGGFARLAESLAGLFEERGGRIELGAEVRRVIVQDGHTTGVETADGRQFLADAVVSAADARQTLLHMVDEPYVPAELRQRVASMALTPSIFQVQLGVDMDLPRSRQGLKRLNFMYASDDIDQGMASFAQGNVDEAAFFVYVATFHQPEMAPPGKHSVKLEAYTRLGARGIDWERDKHRLADVFVRRAERLIPNLGTHIVTRALRTPLDLMRDTGNANGAFAGWAFTPELLSRARPQQRSPLPGLYLAGHWTTPTAGVPWVMLSGYNTAAMVLADRQRRTSRAARPTLARPTPPRYAPALSPFTDAGVHRSG